MREADNVDRIPHKPHSERSATLGGVIADLLDSRISHGQIQLRTKPLPVCFGRSNLTSMSLLLILIILLVLLGGGGYYAGGPRVGGGLAGLILLILIILALTGRL